MNKLTTQDYWNTTYQQRKQLIPSNVNGWRNTSNREIYRLLCQLNPGGKRILEIGGGGSPWLAFLSKTYPQADFACLDYAADGIETLAVFCKQEKINNIRLYQADFFQPGGEAGSFDIVYSLGVVEHFSDLPTVLSCHADFLDEQGVMLTVIPNMAGILGILTRWMNRKVYDIHVPHDEASLLTGHQKADLQVLESGYLCSSNFGVLSSCFPVRSGVKWWIYRLLKWLNYLIWLFEDKVIQLPAFRFFSPYIYVISKKKTVTYSPGNKI